MIVGRGDVAAGSGVGDVVGVGVALGGGIVVGGKVVGGRVGGVGRGGSGVGALVTFGVGETVGLGVAGGGGVASAVGVGVLASASLAIASVSSLDIACFFGGEENLGGSTAGVFRPFAATFGLGFLGISGSNGSVVVVVGGDVDPESVGGDVDPESASPLPASLFVGGGTSISPSAGTFVGAGGLVGLGDGFDRGCVYFFMRSAATATGSIDGIGEGVAIGVGDGDGEDDGLGLA